ncbi:TonB-dependent siderophore receptor [Pseudomonas sp. ABC1]|uniref:TonB-dependent siderophore receptor n=1 Tax=Pseudomonas sp. ABC1 TaxID=2748080 RepID=UPI0015C39720|nr:TonB-dependent siderophore receptor [Pseudomonas sp. ABC1]QLF92847.1 TonB-dependent siderophore receptor [Pseudomonas sp. ABC1]
MARHLSQPSLRPLALAIPLLIGTALAVQAPVSLAAEQQHYDLPAGPLAERLNQFASQAGIYLAGDAGLTRDRQSQALQGNHSVEQALGILLRGTGLNAIRVASGRYELSAQNALELDATNIVDTSAKDSAITEGTGSYTTGVTSTATKMNLSIRETPQSISVVTRQRIDDQDLTSITKVLEQTPGVTIARNSSERFNIYSRGSEITKYQFDGLTTHVESQTQNLSQQLVDMSIYDRIEVVRGATGLMTGAGNVSGMVNMVRKKPTAKFQANLAGSVGRWDDYRGSVDISGPLIDSGKLRARFVGAKQENDSFIDYYSQKRDVYYGVMEADITDTTEVRFGIDHNKYEVNGGADSPLFYTDGQQTNLSRSATVTSKHQNQEIETTNYFFNIDQALANDWKLVIAGGHMDVDRELSNSVNMNQGGTTGINRETGNFLAIRTAKIINPLSQKSAAINLQGPFSLFGREHQAIIGYEFNRYKSHWTSYGYGSTTVNLTSIHTADQLPENPYSIQDFYIIQRGYYGALRLNPIDKLYVILGARSSNYKYNTAFIMPIYNYSDKSGYRKSGEVTPYAGLVYDLTPQQSVYFSYTDIFNPNNVTDINRKVIEPQVGSNYEIGWKGEFYDGQLNANVAIYQVKRDNATELAGRDASNIAYYRAIDGVKTNGIDIEITGEVLPSWNVSASYSHSRSEDANDTRRTAEHPLDTVKLWSTYKFPGDWQNLTIGGGARWQSKIATTPTYSYFFYKATQDDFVVVDAMARYKFNQHLSASLNANNIFDKKYYSGIGNLNMGFYGEPRNLTLGVRYDF